MKNEDLFRHRQLVESKNSNKGLMGVGLLAIIFTILIWAATAWVILFYARRWGLTDLNPKWHELNAISACLVVARVWHTSIFRQHN